MCVCRGAGGGIRVEGGQWGCGSRVMWVGEGGGRLFFMPSELPQLSQAIIYTPLQNTGLPEHQRS